MFIVRRFCLSVALLAAVCGSSLAQEAEVSLSVTNGNLQLDLPRVPGTQEYRRCSRLTWVWISVS
jgi:hypothetical protein